MYIFIDFREKKGEEERELIFLVTVGKTFKKYDLLNSPLYLHLETINVTLGSWQFLIYSDNKVDLTSNLSLNEEVMRYSGENT